MDSQIDYAAGMPLAILLEVPVTDPTALSPTSLRPSTEQVDDFTGLPSAMPEEPQTLEEALRTELRPARWRLS